MLKCQDYGELPSRILSGLVALVLMAIAWIAAPAYAETSFSLGTGGTAGVYHKAGNAICNIVNAYSKEPELDCDPANTAGSNENISRVMTGEFGFGMAQSDWQAHALRGGPSWRDNAQPGLRSIMSLHAEPFHLIAGAKSGIYDWQDLQDKKINIGNIGSGQRGTMEEMLRAGGWTYGNLAAAFQMNSSEHARALCRGKIDAFVFSVGVPSNGIRWALENCEARIVDLRNSPATDLVTAARPWYSWVTISPEIYPQLAAPIRTFGVRATIVSRANYDETTVYEFTKLVFENIEQLKGTHAALQGLEPAEMIRSGLTAPLHPGAEKYYRQRGWIR